MTEGPPIPRIPRDKRLPRGVRALPPEVVAAIHRERLQRGIAEVIERRGYAATAIADITGAARAEKAVFRKHFEAKAHCLDAAADEALDSLWPEVEDAVPGAGDPTGALRAALDAYLGFLAADSSRAHLLTVEVLTASARARERWRELNQRLAGLLQEVAAQRGAQPSPPPSVAEGLIAGLLMLVSARIVAGEAQRLPELAPELLEVLLAPYLGGERASALARPRTDGR